jgi:hypothetical protein
MYSSKQNKDIKTKTSKQNKSKQNKTFESMGYCSSMERVYTTKINELEKQSHKYKTRSKVLLDVITTTNVKLLNVKNEANNEAKNESKNEATANFNSLNTQTDDVKSSKEDPKCSVYLNRNNDSVEKAYFTCLMIALLWGCIFIGLLKFVHKANGLSDYALELVHGAFGLSCILSCIMYHVGTRYLL